MYDVTNTDTGAVTASSIKLYNWRLAEAERRRQAEDAELLARKREEEREARRAERRRKKEEKRRAKEQAAHEAKLLQSGYGSELLAEEYGSEGEDELADVVGEEEDKEEKPESDPGKSQKSDVGKSQMSEADRATDVTPATQLTETVVEEGDEESERDSSVERFYAMYEDLDGGSENFLVDDDEASAEGVQDSASQASMYNEDRAYAAWLRKWGDIDFSKLAFLPYLLSNEQLMASARIMRVQDERRLRSQQIHQGMSVTEINE